MATILEKLKQEERNTRMIILWPEGSFYKGYEKSAFLFVTHLRPYEVQRRFVKLAGCEVASIGFPQTVLTSLGKEYEKRTDGSVVIQLDAVVDEQKYLLWAEGAQHGGQTSAPTALREPVTQGPAPRAEQLARRISEFNLASATPMQCMLFVAELQKMLRP